MRLTHRAHRAVASVLAEGDLAVDATAGNGHDTLFLAEQVGEAGCVWAFDVQEAAIAGTRERLEAAAVLDRVRLVHDTHSAMDQYLLGPARGGLGAVMFNLGYLPGSDQTLITGTDTTIPALEQAVRYLRAGGLLSLMVYRGHPGGRNEWQGIQQWLTQRHERWEHFGDPGRDCESPLLILVHA